MHVGALGMGFGVWGGAWGSCTERETKEGEGRFVLLQVLHGSALFVSFGIRNVPGSLLGCCAR